MDDLVRFTYEWDGATQTLHVAGELDIATAPALDDAAARTLNGKQGDFRLDLSGLTFMDSTGAQALLHIKDGFETHGRRVVVVAPEGQVRGVLELLGLHQALKLEP